MNYVTERREEEKERRRQAILDAAEQVFSTEGFDAATMDRVARAARVSRALVYVYFKDKDALHLGICLRGLKTLKEMFKNARQGQSTGYEQVRAIGQAYRVFAQTHPTRFAAMSHFESKTSSAESPDGAQAEMLDLGKQVHEETVLALVQGQTDGTLRADLGDLMQVSMTLWAFSHGVIQLAQTKTHFMNQVGIEKTRFMENAVELAMHSLVAPKPPGVQS